MATNSAQEGGSRHPVQMWHQPFALTLLGWSSKHVVGYAVLATCSLLAPQISCLMRLLLSFFCAALLLDTNHRQVLPLRVIKAKAMLVWPTSSRQRASQ
jgi:hypothetical protein